MSIEFAYQKVGIVVKMKNSMPILNPRNLLTAALAGLSLGLSSCGSPGGSSSPALDQKPNIIFLMADDMGYGDPGSYNPESKIPTPHMDRLAAEGMRFTDAHSPSAVCSPTRYGVLTGRYAWRGSLKRGVLSGYSPSLIEEGRLTVASLLRQQGYRTAVVGKWHLGLDWATSNRPDNNSTLDAPNFGKPAGLEVDFSQPVRRGPNQLGFDYSYIIPASLDMAPYVYLENGRSTEPADDRTEGMRDGGVFWREGEKGKSFDFLQVTPHLTDKAVAFIDQQRAGANSRPFFLYFALPSPHTPWMPTAEVQGKSGAGKYGDFVVLVDRMVGRIAEALELNGLARNTLFIVTSDNGSDWRPEHIKEFNHHSNHKMLRGRKRDAWEGGHRVPFIARWPEKVKPGSMSDETITHTDLMATAATITGTNLPAGSGEDSYSLLPVLLGKDLEGPLREATVHHSADGMFCLRQGEWKLIDGQGPGSNQWDGPKPGDPPGQLYNLEDDMGENNNRFNERPEMVERLNALLADYKQRGSSRPMQP